MMDWIFGSTAGVAVVLFSCAFFWLAAFFFTAFLLGRCGFNRRRLFNGFFRFGDWRLFFF